jgi:hypothetical protein
MSYATPPGTAFFTVRQLKLNRALSLYSGFHLRFLVPKYVRDNPGYGIYWEFTWMLILEEEGEGNPRLIPRTRASYGPHRALAMALLLVGGEVFTARKTLCGIKRRAERADERNDSWLDSYMGGRAGTKGDSHVRHTGKRRLPCIR